MFLLYKEGSSRQGRGSVKYAVPGMKWVGLRPSQLEGLDLPHQVRLLKLFSYAQTTLAKNGILRRCHELTASVLILSFVADEGAKRR